MKAILTILLSFGLVVSLFGQTRNVVVGTNGAIVQPTNFWSADVTNARSGLGLDSAATNPASAFQPSSTVLSNLASSNAVNITNLRATNIVGTVALASNVSGIISIANGGTAATTAGEARTNLNVQQASVVLSNLANSNGSDLTNITISSLGTIAISNGGTGATNAATARTNLGLGATWLTNTDIANFRTNIELGATWLTNTNVTNFRSSIGFSTNLETLWVATNASNARSAIGLGAASLVPDTTNIVNTTNITLNSSRALDVVVSPSGGWSLNDVITLPTNNPQNGDIVKIIFRSSPSSSPLIVSNTSGLGGPWYIYAGNEARWIYDSTAGPPRWQSLGRTVRSQINYLGDTASDTRANLGLGWPALTNSNAGTSLVSVNTNGEVVSPTNFWDVAPIQTLVQNFTPVANATNAATNARTLYAYSLAISTVGVTNVITLPTNTATKNGDEVTVIHMGPTSSVTRIRQLGSTNNLISISNTDESVKFIYENNAWTNFHNISFVEPIQFSGTNAAANAVTSRNTLQAASSTNYSAGVGEGAADRAQQLIGNDSGTTALIYDELGGDLWEVANPSEFRDAIGIPLAALTNTNNAKFQEAIFATNAAPTNAGNFGDYAAWMGVSIVTNGVTNVFRIPLYK